MDSPTPPAAFWRTQRSIAYAGLGTLAATGAFLVVLTRALFGFVKMTPHDLKTFQRSMVWDIAILEWCVVASFIVWALTPMHYLHRSRRAPLTPE